MVLDSSKLFKSENSPLGIPHHLRHKFSSPLVYREGYRMLFYSAVFLILEPVIRKFFSSANKAIINFLKRVKRIFYFTAIFKGKDEAYKWMLLFASSHPSFQASSSVFEVSKRSSLVKGSDYKTIGDASGKGDSWSRLMIRETLDNNSNTKGEEATNGYYLTPAHEECFHFLFKGINFWLQRFREKDNDGKLSDTIKINYLSTSPGSIHKLIKHAESEFLKLPKEETKVKMYRMDSAARWYGPFPMTKRPTGSLHLAEDVQQSIMDDVQDFLLDDTFKWYMDRAIPYRRGYLFHGPPGTGKSSLAHVIASQFDLKIYLLDLTNEILNDARLHEVLSALPRKCILLIEDVDVAFKQRSRVVKIVGQEQYIGISFSTFLNALDGVGAAEGRLLCMTTNHIDHLDKALIRGGRIDRQVEFFHANQEQAKNLFIRLYSQGGEDDTEIKRQADNFAEAIPPDLLSVSSLQVYLLSHLKDPRKAVEGIQKWIEKQKKARVKASKPPTNGTTLKAQVEMPKVMQPEIAIQTVLYNSCQYLYSSRIIVAVKISLCSRKGCFQ